MFRTTLSITAIVMMAACNQPPAGGTVSIEPAEPSANDDLVAAITDFSVDPNAKDTVEYTVVWKLNGADVEEFADKMTVDASWTKVGQEWTVQVTPRDGKAFGVAFSDSVAITNTAPTASAVSISPSELREGDTATATVEGSDPDGDDVEMRYSWFVNDRDVGQSGATLSSDHFDKGDDVLVKVTPFDGTVEGAPQTSDAVPVVNSPPSITSAVINPGADADLDTIFSCSATGWSDLDGDAEAYQHEWFVNGKPVSTDSSLRAPSFTNGDLVYCEMTPDDGEDFGAAMRSEQVEIYIPPRPCEDQALPTDPNVGLSMDPYQIQAVSTFGFDVHTSRARHWCSEAGKEPLAITVTIYDRDYDGSDLRDVCVMRLIPTRDDATVDGHNFSFDLGSGEVSYSHHGFTFPSGAFTAEDYAYETADGDVVGSCLQRRFDADTWGSDFATLFEDQDWGIYVGEFAAEIESTLSAQTDDPSTDTDIYDLYTGGYFYGGSQQASSYVETAPLLYGTAYDVESDWYLSQSHDPDDPYVRIRARDAVPGTGIARTGVYQTSALYVWFAKPLLLGVSQD